jgi:hypothetical protein
MVWLYQTIFLCCTAYHLDVKKKGIVLKKNWSPTPSGGILHSPKEARVQGAVGR